MSTVAEIRNLVVAYAGEAGTTYALDGVSLIIDAGDTIGIVGESGSGKSTLGMAIGRLLASNAVFEQGEVLVGDVKVLRCDTEVLRSLRRDRLGFVFQNPMAALDPTMRIGRQVSLALGKGADGAVIRSLLLRAGLDDPDTVAASFPHELSGGMAQRVVIALAIARAPAIVVADEPTASLDASIKGVILELLLALGRDTGCSLLIMSHDLRMVARRCERIVVMYAGRVVEAGSSSEVFAAPRHPYTKALVRAAAGNEGPGGRLEPIPGVPPLLVERSRSCAFAPRCPFVQPLCRSERPPEIAVDGRRVACHFAAGGLTLASDAQESAS